MGWLLQTVAGVMAALVAWIILTGRGKEYANVISIGACCLALMVGLRFIEPVFELLGRLESLGNLQPEWLTTMLKTVGIGLIVEIGVLICTDAGNAVLGKTLQILGTIAVLLVSVPLMRALVDLLEAILGGI